MDRVLEPEIMDGEVEADAYARADFSDSNRWYVNTWCANWQPAGAGRRSWLRPRRCAGTARARAMPAARITAVDGSAAMLRRAVEAIRAAGMHDRVRVHQGRLPDPALAEHSFDAVLSKDMLHHLPDPQVLWSEARRLGRAGGAVYVMDLMRPDSPLEAREIVERVSGDEDPVLKEDFYNSLCAAFTIEEVRAQLRAAGLPLHVEQISDRHMLVKGRI